MTSVFLRPTRVLAIGVGVLAACVVVLAAGAFSVAHAVPEPPTARSQPALAAVGLSAQQPTDPTTDPNTGSTLPPGPRIEPEESEQATQDRTQRKVIIAAVAAGLLAIVFVGRKKRNKNKPGKK